MIGLRHVSWSLARRGNAKDEHLLTPKALKSTRQNCCPDIEGFETKLSLHKGIYFEDLIDAIAFQGCFRKVKLGT